jgi:hypothetical protein
MSSYGPQGGPYPGQPQDPWQDGSADDSYSSGYPDPLTGPGFGVHTGQASHTGHGSATGYPPGFGQYGGRPGPGTVTGEVWGPPQAPVRPGRSGTAIGVIIVVVLLAVGGAGIATFLLTRDDGGDPSVSPTVGQSSADPSAVNSSPAPSASTPNADAKVAKAGDCLVNRGSATTPDMQKVPCAANSYQVLKRIDGTSDKTKCDGTAGLTDWYFFDHSDDKQDFVLCLKKR